MQHGNNIYSMPNGFMLSIGKGNIYTFHPKKRYFLFCFHLHTVSITTQDEIWKGRNKNINNIMKLFFSGDRK